MITTISELSEATTFERMALEAAGAPLGGTRSIDVENSRAAGVTLREHTSHVKIAQPGRAAAARAMSGECR